MSVRYFGSGGVEWTRKQFDDYCFTFTNPIWDAVVADLNICTNCRCTDCGCCYGCGEVDADMGIDPYTNHGYGCI